MKNLYKYILLSIILFISSCVTHKMPNLEKEQNDSFYSVGRLNIKYKNKGYYSNFELIKTKNLTILKINYPLGSTLGQLCMDSSKIYINDYKNNSKYSNLINEFTNKIIDQEIPINDITLWIIGKYNSKTNISNKEIIQNGWKIKRLLDKSNKPKNIEISKNDIYIKFIFDEFEINNNLTTQNNCQNLINIQ